MNKLDLYIADAVVLSAGVYLHSPAVCLGGIALWGIVVAEKVLTKASKDAEIVVLVARAEAYEKKLKQLESEIMNVAERAKTVLGEVY